MYPMKLDCGYYGKAIVPQDVFSKLNPGFFISSSTDTVKFMCANRNEIRHLRSLGIDATDDYDWFKIVRA